MLVERYVFRHDFKTQTMDILKLDRWCIPDGGRHKTKRALTDWLKMTLRNSQQPLTGECVKIRVCRVMQKVKREWPIEMMQMVQCCCGKIIEQITNCQNSLLGQHTILTGEIIYLYLPVRTWTPRMPHAWAPPTSLMMSSPIITTCNKPIHRSRSVGYNKTEITHWWLLNRRLQCLGCEWVIILGFPPLMYPSTDWGGICDLPVAYTVVSSNISCFNFISHSHGFRRWSARGTVAQWNDPHLMHSTLDVTPDLWGCILVLMWPLTYEHEF